jgi:hypothetical protein
LQVVAAVVAVAAAQQGYQALMGQGQQIKVLLVVLVTAHLQIVQAVAVVVQARLAQTALTVH